MDRQGQRYGPRELEGAIRDELLRALVELPVVEGRGVDGVEQLP
jgi:hypothetical protein